MNADTGRKQALIVSDAAETEPRRFAVQGAILANGADGVMLISHADMQIIAVCPAPELNRFPLAVFREKAFVGLACGSCLIGELAAAS